MTITELVKNQQQYRIGELNQQRQGKPFDTSILGGYRQGVDMQAHFRFEAAPSHSYAAVFNVVESKVHIISLDAR